VTGFCDIRNLFFRNCYRSLIVDNLCYINLNCSFFYQVGGLNLFWRLIKATLSLLYVIFLFIRGSNYSSIFYNSYEMDLLNADLIEALSMYVKLEQLRLAQQLIRKF
jgi:hypothetical protein